MIILYLCEGHNNHDTPVLIEEAQGPKYTLYLYWEDEHEDRDTTV